MQMDLGRKKCSPPLIEPGKGKGALEKKEELASMGTKARAGTNTALTIRALLCW